MTDIKYYKNLFSKVLINYDLNISEIEFICEETNVFLKLHSEDCLYAAKVFQEASSKLSDNLAEVFFINTVVNNTDLNVPEVIMNKENSGITLVEDIYGNTKRIAIYQWLDGSDIEDRETPELFYELGKTVAKLHKATKNVEYPESIQPKRWDKVFYYIGEEAEYRKPEYQKYITEEYISTMDYIIDHLNNELPKIYKNKKTQLIHGDMNPNNIMVNNKNEIQIIDFEEAFDALPVHDFAVFFFYYEYNDQFEYEDVKQHFIEGYRTIDPEMVFDFRQINILITARRVNFLNYCLTVMDNPEQYINNNLKRVQKYIASLKMR